MIMARWSRIAALCLLIGGIGYLGKYVLLALLDSNATSHSNGLQAVTTLGLLLGELLLPIGVTAFPARWLAGRRIVVIIVGFFAAVVALFVVGKGLDAAFASMAGDPFRLRTEGTLGVIGLVAGVAGFVLLLVQPSRRQRAPRRQAGSALVRAVGARGRHK